MTQENDAINEQPLDDVSAEQQQAAGEDQPNAEPTAREPSEREKRLAELAKQYRDVNGYGEEPGDDPEPEAEAADEGDDPEVDNEQDAEQQEAAGKREPEDDAAPDPFEELGYYRKDDGKLYTKMKINGEEREVAAEQIKAYLQKDLAGDYKLQQAAERERQLQQLEQQIRTRESQFRQTMTKQPPEMGAEEVRQQAKSVLAKLWDGDDEAAAEALTQFIQQNTGRVNTDELLTEAEQRAMSAMERRETEKQQQKWQASVAEGNQWLSSQHPEIYQDQKLFNLVNGETERMVEAQQNGDPEFADLTPRQIIERAAQDVQSWMDGRKEPAADKKADDSREERKRNLRPMPRGMSKQPTQKQPKEVDDSPAAVIARMREARSVN